MFARIIKNHCETGSINPRKRNRRKTRTDEAAEVDVLGAVANNPHLGTRQIESCSGISKSSVHRILKRHKFHPYHASLHQELHYSTIVLSYNNDPTATSLLSHLRH
jgi:hypothetical protein